MRPGSVTTVAELEENYYLVYLVILLLVMSDVNCLFDLSLEHTCIGKIRTYIVQSNITERHFESKPFTRFVRGRVEFVDGQLQVTPVGLDKSSAISSLAEANAFIVLPGGTRGFEAGITVSVLLLESNAGSEWPWEEPLRSYK